jgi:hypothetical protein
VAFDLYAWKSPRDLDADRAEALLESWRASGSDPGTSPFEPSADVGSFHRELMKDVPGLVVSTDAVPNPINAPIWLAATSEQPPARLVVISLSPTAPGNTLQAILGLAAKYDLALFDARSRRVHRPLEEMAAHASATFWPAGAIQAAVVGVIGGVIAVVAWLLGIPLLSGVLVVVGGFLVLMAVYTFIHEGRKARNSRP